jgi:hypothetical protein
MRTFDSFTSKEIEKTFGIKRNVQSNLLNEWLSATYSFSDEENNFLIDFNKKTKDELSYWNEDELRFFFIGPLFARIKFFFKDYNSYVLRKITANIKGIEIEGNVSFMLCNKNEVNKPPYYFVHNYNSAIEYEGEPLGKLLIAMLACQSLNKKERLILGLYLIGKDWIFVTLEGNEYTISQTFDASSKDIFQIFAILQKSKEIIQQYI